MGVLINVIKDRISHENISSVNEMLSVSYSTWYDFNTWLENLAEGKEDPHAFYPLFNGVMTDDEFLIDTEECKVLFEGLNKYVNCIETWEYPELIYVYKALMFLAKQAVDNKGLILIR